MSRRLSPGWVWCPTVNTSTSSASNSSSDTTTDLGPREQRHRVQEVERFALGQRRGAVVDRDASRQALLEDRRCGRRPRRRPRRSLRRSALPCRSTSRSHRVIAVMIIRRHHDVRGPTTATRDDGARDSIAGFESPGDGRGIAMRIGLSGSSGSVERVVEHAARGRSGGVHVALVPGRERGRSADSRLSRGAGQRPPSRWARRSCRPIPAIRSLMAGRATTVANAMERTGFTLGIGPSHEPVIEGVYGMSYAHAGRHTEEYATVLTQLLRGDTGRVRGRRLPSARAREGTRAGAGPGAHRRTRTSTPARGRCHRRRHHHLDGECTSARVIDRTFDRPGRARRRTRHATRGRRAPGVRPRRRRRGARRRRGTVRDLRHAAQLPAGARRRRHRRAGRRGDRRQRGLGARRRSRRCSPRAPPTCGPTRSSSATTAPRRASAPARCSATSPTPDDHGTNDRTQDGDEGPHEGPRNGPASRLVAGGDRASRDVRFAYDRGSSVASSRPGHTTIRGVAQR